MDFETIDPGNISLRALRRYEGWVYLKNYVVEGSAEVCAVYGGVTRGLGIVDIFATSAVQLDRFDIWNI